MTKEELAEQYKTETDGDAWCIDAFIAGYEAGESKWINVGEQTPDFEIPVLIKYIKGKQGEVITQGYYRDEAERMGTYPNSNTDTEFWRNCGYG